MVWKGVVIEESLEDKQILESVKIINTKETTLELEEEKGTLHFHKIAVEDKKKDEFIEKARNSLKKGAWYIHICKNETMAIIFKDKTFEFSKDQANQLEEARNYGRSIGIIDEQMPFEKMLSDPFA